MKNMATNRPYLIQACKAFEPWMQAKELENALEDMETEFRDRLWELAKYQVNGEWYSLLCEYYTVPDSYDANGRHYCLGIMVNDDWVVDNYWFETDLSPDQARAFTEEVRRHVPHVCGRNAEEIRWAIRQNEVDPDLPTIIQIPNTVGSNEVMDYISGLYDRTVDYFEIVPCLSLENT